MPFYGAVDDPRGSSVRWVFDRLQSNLFCCGSSSFEDWFSFTWDTSPGIVTGAIVGFPASGCDEDRAVVENAKLGQISQKCISYTLPVYKDRLQPFERGCVEPFDQHLK